MLKVKPDDTIEDFINSQCHQRMSIYKLRGHNAIARSTGNNLLLRYIGEATVLKAEIVI
jgi:hypothetical protein